MYFINWSTCTNIVCIAFFFVFIDGIFFRFLLILILRWKSVSWYVIYFEKSRKQIPERIRNLNSESEPILLLIPLQQGPLKFVNIKIAGTNFTKTEIVVGKKKHYWM